MARFFSPLVVALVGSLTLPGAAYGQDPAEPAVARVAPLVTTEARLAASLERIARGSALWRADLEAVRGTGRHAFIFTPAHVVTVDERAVGASEAFDLSVLAEVAPVMSGDSQVSAVLVVVNLDLLDRMHSRRGSLPAERDADLDRILVHEVYGHAFPYLRAGSLSGRCPDPTAGEPAVTACSIVRENAVRAELGLGRRADYGLNSLLLSR
jgi:hypothetical protein